MEGKVKLTMVAGEIVYEAEWRGIDIFPGDYSLDQFAGAGQLFGKYSGNSGILQMVFLKYKTPHRWRVTWRPFIIINYKLIILQ
jgi:hypothetical protein